MSSQRVELARQLANININISTANSQIRVLQGQIDEIEEAQSQLSEIIGIAGDDNHLLDSLECEDLHLWKGHNQTLRATDYSECQQMMSEFTRRLDSWDRELATAHLRVSRELSGQESTLAGLNASHRHVTDLMRRLSN